MLSSYDLYEIENKLHAQGYKYVAGLDEAGRGSWAGPIYVGFVIFDKKYKNDKINDSKKLSKKTREILYDEIKKHALISQTFMIDVECVDKYNVKEASKYGMKELIINSNIKPDICLIDYEKIEINKMKTISYTKGDEKCFSIAAASILAKVERDRYMENVHKKYPNYGFNRHVGYGTKLHSDMIKKYGIINNLHRKSFKPIIKLMSN